ncbi:MAG: hypothetical protein PVS2B2_08470 [Candidatus Acidiferrum sp.]
MTKTPANFSSKNDLSRCQYRMSNGSRCRLPVSDASYRLCSAHLAARTALEATFQENPPVDADLSTDLGTTSGEFNSTEEIYNFLGKLIFLLSANRISSRRAAVLAYITNQLLHATCVLQKEFEAEQKNDPQKIIIDVVRPIREPIVDPPSQPS